MLRLAAITIAGSIAAATLGTSGAATAQDRVVVFAAASLKNALDDVNAKFAGNARVVASYGASSALMKQIEQGAPADVFISADAEWMDYRTIPSLPALRRREKDFPILRFQVSLVRLVS